MTITVCPNLSYSKYAWVKHKTNVIESSQKLEMFVDYMAIVCNARYSTGRRADSARTLINAY